jgi:hypothetical protein
MSKRASLIVAGMVAAALAVVIGVVAYQLHVRAAEQTTLAVAPTQGKTQALPQTQPTTTTRPAPLPAETPVEKTYMDVIRAEFPSLPTTQPLAAPLDLSQAARMILRDPLYLSKSRGDLWITRSDAPPIKQLLHELIDPTIQDSQSHVLPERVAYVHWMPSESGPWIPYLVCRNEKGTGYEVVWAKDRKALPVQREFDWDRAFSWNENVVMPSRTGVSILRFGPNMKESFQQLVPDSTANAGQPQALLDWQGLLVWAPWERGATGSNGAFRYVDGKWRPLGPEQGWPRKLAYLVPLHDGTVFQFVQGTDDAITVQTTSLDQAAVDEQAIGKLVAQLSDIDQDVRHKAFADLANFGPGAWPVLEKLSKTQSPQARVLLAQLLKDRNRPTLSGMTLLGKGSLTLVSRLSDGGVVFYAEQGVSIPESDNQTTTTAPAWLSIRPGHYVELLPAAMVVDLKPDACTFEVVGDQWIVSSDARRPRLFYGNGTATLLRKDELAFSRPLGMDQLGRWLFREPTPKPGATPPTLIIDPHLPDPTPRLPAWQLAIAETVGWDKDNWPVVQNGAAYALMDSDWRPMDKSEKVFTMPTPPASSTQPSSATQPSSPTQPPSSIEPTTQAAEPPILTAPDGTRYFGGLTDLRVTKPDGKTITWPLPDIANGAGPVWLVRDHSGKLFLFNQPGRVLRIAPKPKGPEPFKLEATFTRNIPSGKLTRVWFDPAGRIDITWGNRLAILFPDGYIPREILQKIVDRSGLDAEGQ